MTEPAKNFQQLWRKLGTERRRAAANALLQKGDSTQQRLAAHLIATKLNFRPHKAAQLPIERKANYVAGMDNLDEAMAGSLVRDYLFAQQKPMLTKFLDGVGIPHKEGEIQENADIPKPTPEALKAGLEAIRGEFNPEEIEIYTSALTLSDPDFWGELRTIDAGTPAAQAPAS